MSIWKQGERFADQTVFILASGPSMTQADADILKGQTVITVNTTWKLAPWAAVHYSSDHDWWEVNIHRMREECSGEFWTGHPSYDEPDVKRCAYDKQGRGLSKTPGVINWGGNSGYCAIGLAHQFGAKRIILLGFDQGETKGFGHWHPDHPAKIAKAFNWPMWKTRFTEMAIDADRMGVEILNCSRTSSLTCFPRVSLESVL